MQLRLATAHKVIFFVLIGLLSCSCANESYCVAQSEGQNVSEVWPISMTRDECETLCQRLKTDVVREDLDGYCRFGDNDLIWTHTQYQNADAQKIFLNDTNILGKEVPPSHFSEEKVQSTCAYQTGTTAEGESATSELSLLMTRDECEDYCQPAKALTLESDVWGFCVFGADDYVWTHRYNY